MKHDKIPYLLMLEIGITLFNKLVIFVSLEKKKNRGQISLGNNATIVSS